QHAPDVSQQPGAVFAVGRRVDRTGEPHFVQRVVLVGNPLRKRLAQMMLPGAWRGRRRVDRKRLDFRRRRMSAIVDVFVEHVDFPEGVIGIADPELGLERVATLDALLALGVKAGGLEPALNLDELFGVADTQADVIQMSPGGRTSWY